MSSQNDGNEAGFTEIDLKEWQDQVFNKFKYNITVVNFNLAQEYLKKFVGKYSAQDLHWLLRKLGKYVDEYRDNQHKYNQCVKTLEPVFKEIFENNDANSINQRTVAQYLAQYAQGRLKTIERLQEAIKNYNNYTNGLYKNNQRDCEDNSTQSTVEEKRKHQQEKLIDAFKGIVELNSEDCNVFMTQLVLAEIQLIDKKLAILQQLSQYAIASENNKKIEKMLQKVSGLPKEAMSCSKSGQDINDLKKELDDKFDLIDKLKQQRNIQKKNCSSRDSGTDSVDGICDPDGQLIQCLKNLIEKIRNHLPQRDFIKATIDCTPSKISFLDQIKNRLFKSNIPKIHTTASTTTYLKL